jgi:hypothetical protein
MAETPRDIKDWQELTKLTQGASLVVERVRMGDIAIEGAFELPQLARLTMEDQVFVAAFLKSHGSIKEMEQVFGVSYPTVKARLNRIAGQLEFVDTNPAPLKTGRNDILNQLERGDITAAEAIRRLEVK